MMSKEQIETILNANNYLIECKCNGKCRKRYEYARKYLNLTVQKVLFRPKRERRFDILISVMYLVISVIR